MHTPRNVVFSIFMGICTFGPVLGGFDTMRMTLYERESPAGPRHSPLFSLPVGDGEFPSRMALFHNDIFSDEDDLVNEDDSEIIGYDQDGTPAEQEGPGMTTTEIKLSGDIIEGHCVETVFSSGYIAECYLTFFVDGIGSLTANGPYVFDVADGVRSTMLALTGGTGAYKCSTGEVEVSAGPAEEFASLRYDFDIIIPHECNDMWHGSYDFDSW